MAPRRNRRRGELSARASAVADENARAENAFDEEDDDENADENADENPWDSYLDTGSIVYGQSISARVADKVVPAPGSPVWWCEQSGAILADGLWVGESLDRAFVNLTGDDAPELTVDRRSIRSHDKDAAQRHLRSAHLRSNGATGTR